MKKNYADFYAENYSSYILESRLIGGDNPVSMFEVHQPPGAFPDPAFPTYNLQLNIGSLCNAQIDLGVGEYWFRIRHDGFCLAPADTATTYDVVTPVNLMMLGVPKRIVENAAEYLGIHHFNPEALLRYPHNDPAIAYLMKDCWKQGKPAAHGNALFVDANLMAIAVRIVALAQKGAALAPPKRVETLTQQGVNHIAHFVDTHIDDDIRVATLAGIAKMPEFAFTRAFRTFTGLSPHQWVMERRIALAARLLDGKTLSVAEVAYAVGFSSQAHMTTAFSRRMGVTPAAYRKQR